MCPQKLRKLPRQTVYVDKKGRICIPKYLREEAEIKEEGWVTVEAYPDLDKCKGLLVMRDY